MSWGEIDWVDLSCFLKHSYQGGVSLQFSWLQTQREALYPQNNVLRVFMKMYYFVSFLTILLLLISIPPYHFLSKGFTRMDAGITAYVYSGMCHSETNRISCHSCIKS